MNKIIQYLMITAASILPLKAMDQNPNPINPQHTFWGFLNAFGDNLARRDQDTVSHEQNVENSMHHRFFGVPLFNPEKLGDKDCEGALNDYIQEHTQDSGEEITRIKMIHGNLGGNIPRSLGDRTTLEFLDLSFNSLTLPVPQELGRLKKLKNLGLYSNDLIGVIPTSFGDLESLENLNLGRNKLVGEIPPELSRLNKLQGLWLCHNLLTGEIPKELAGLDALESLDLSHNSLTGSIPPELGTLKKLKGLRLQNNKLEGNIPTELDNLEALEWLDVSGNALSGMFISPQLANLTNLTACNNNFTGFDFSGRGLATDLIVKIHNNPLVSFFGPTQEQAGHIIIDSNSGIKGRVDMDASILYSMPQLWDAFHDLLTNLKIISLRNAHITVSFKNVKDHWIVTDRTVVEIAHNKSGFIVKESLDNDRLTALLQEIKESGERPSLRVKSARNFLVESPSPKKQKI